MTINSSNTNNNNNNERDSAQLQMANSIYASVFILINTFETILPVIQEPLQQAKLPSASYNFDQNVSINHRYSGNFEKVYINERKLSFKRRQFNVSLN